MQSLPENMFKHRRHAPPLGEGRKTDLAAIKDVQDFLLCELSRVW